VSHQLSTWPKNVTKLNVQFLNPSCKETYSAGWSPRIRKTKKEDELKLTYKTRYPITGDDIDAALTAANRDRFNASTAKYEAQVEWGYKNHALSISRKKSIAGNEDNRRELPTKHDSRKCWSKKRQTNLAIRSRARRGTTSSRASSSCRRKSPASST
jgi:hypothetical protein